MYLNDFSCMCNSFTAVDCLMSGLKTCQGTRGQGPVGVSENDPLGMSQLKVRVPPPETYGEIMMHDAEMPVRSTYYQRWW